MQYGHKLSLSSGASGLVLDVIVEDGNPADSVCLLPLLQRHVAHYGRPPRDLAADGGYASAANLADAKSLGVAHVAFHKRVGLTVDAMTGDRWLYNKLRRFRAGIESDDLVSETMLWPVTLRLERARPLQSVCAQCRVYPQSRGADPASRSRLSSRVLKINDGDRRQGHRRHAIRVTAKSASLPKTSRLLTTTDTNLLTLHNAIMLHHRSKTGILDRY